MANYHSNFWALLVSIWNFFGSLFQSKDKAVQEQQRRAEKKLDKKSDKARVQFLKYQQRLDEGCAKILQEFEIFAERSSELNRAKASGNDGPLVKQSERDYQASVQRLYGLYGTIQTILRERREYFHGRVQKGVTSIRFPLELSWERGHKTLHFTVEDSLKKVVNSGRDLRELLNGRYHSFEDEDTLFEVDINTGEVQSSQQRELTMDLAALVEEDRQILEYYERIDTFDRHLDMLMFQDTRNDHLDLKTAFVSLRRNFLETVVANGFDQGVIGGFNEDFHARIDALDKRVEALTAQRKDEILAQREGARREQPARLMRANSDTTFELAKARAAIQQEKASLKVKGPEYDDGAIPKGSQGSEKFFDGFGEGLIEDDGEVPVPAGGN